MNEPPSQNDRITQMIIIHSDKIAADADSVIAPQLNIFSVFIP